MSVVIELNQVEKTHVISENKVLGVYEVNLAKAKSLKGEYCKLSHIYNLYEEANNWGEVYLKPTNKFFLFYLFAVNFEEEVGFRTEGDDEFACAYDPVILQSFFSRAKQYTVEGKAGFYDDFLALAEEAIAKDLLIYSSIN